MSGFNGTWKLAKVDNFEAYLNALGVDDKIKAKAAEMLTPSNDIRQEITVTDDGITVKSTTPLWTREHTSKFGETFSEKTIDGSDMKVKISKEGDKLVEEQEGSYKSNNTREIVGGDLIYSLTSKGVTTVRTYKRV